ncbi:cell division protein ZapA [Psychrobacter maritimus]|jgi:cell division protein ZapA|uniref:cell division protein ZapA n=1 Tax=Psychrobacter maritimus TaxID=256325 RepID=UPI00248D0791|nr:cell division protein ZapA [Psychrobacter sp. WB2]WGV13334.1 cell division protein ZapA [Psychrobacter sp. WB2]
MTDDRANPVDSQKPMPNNSNTDSSNTNSNNANSASTNSASANSTNTNSSTVNSSAARPAAKAASAPEPQIKKVDVAIAGVTYPIYCPVHEQEELHSAVSYINNYALDLKRDAPSLSQESLLVLCCLNLYEKIHANQRSEEDRLQQSKQSEALLNKIMKDAHSIL